MPKYQDSPMTAASLRNYLESQDDFGLELAIYAKCLSLGLVATHGGTYEDSVTRKTRQFDVRAHAVRERRRIDLAIECKSLKSSYPLLISQIPRNKGECYHEVVRSATRIPSIIAADIRPPSKTLNLNIPDGMYPVGGMVGKSTVQVGLTDKNQFTSGDSEVYEKWTQALDSSSELIQDAAFYEETYNGTFHTTVLPFLVVSDGTLWTADYFQDGRLIGDPMKSEHTTIFMGREYWRPGGISYRASHLHVCTKTGMEWFLERLVSDEGLWDMLFPQNGINRALSGE